MSVSAALQPSRTHGGALTFVVATLAAFAYLSATVDPPVTHLDTARDWLSARDCLRGDCPSQGPTASVLGLRQGALWIRVLAWGLGAGLDATGVQRLLMALQALGAGALALAATRAGRTGWPAGLLSLLYVLVLRAVDPGDVLWNPALAHPGVALFAAGALGLAAGGGPALSVLAGAGAALAVLGHVLGLVLLPVLAWTLATARARPLVCLALGGAAFAGPLLLDSWQAVAIDASALAAAGLAWAPPAATVAGLGAGLLLHRRLAGASDRLRVTLQLALALAVALAAAVVLPAALGADQGRRFAFLLPPFVGLAVALAIDAHLARVRARLVPVLGAALPATALVLGAATWSRHDHAGPEAPWRLPEVERLAADLYGRGATYAELFRRVQGPWDRYLLGTLAGLDPATHPGAPDAGPASGLLVVRLARDQVPTPLPQGWRRVDVGPDRVALLRDTPGGLATRDLLLCGPAEGAAPACRSFDRAWHENTSQAPTFFDRLYPHLTPDATCAEASASPTRWSLPLEPVEHPRLAWLPAPRWEGCTWRLAGADDPQGRTRRIPATPGARVDVETVPGSAACQASCAPPPLVVAPADDPVTARLRAAGNDAR